MHRKKTPGEDAASPRALAELPELMAFAGFLAQYVQAGNGRDELTLATASVVRKARELRADAVSVVAAVELIGCPPLRLPGEGARKRGDRYSEALAWLVRSLFGGQ